MRNTRGNRGISNDVLHLLYFKGYRQGDIESSRSLDAVDWRFDSTMCSDLYVTPHNIPAADHLGRIPEHMENTSDNDCSWKRGVIRIRGRENRWLRKLKRLKQPIIWKC